MCYALELVTRKEISIDDLNNFKNNYGINFYNKTAEMNNPQKGSNYYTVLYGGCSCDFYYKHNSDTVHILDLFKKYVREGNLTLLFMWQDEDYEELCNDIHKYIDSPNVRKINMPITEFLYYFMTENFEGKDIIYTVYNDIK